MRGLGNWADIADLANQRLPENSRLILGVALGQIAQDFHHRFILGLVRLGNRPIVIVQKLARALTACFGQRVNRRSYGTRAGRGRVCMQGDEKIRALVAGGQNPAFQGEEHIGITR